MTERAKQFALPIDTTVLNGRFRLIRAGEREVLGQGGFGITYLARDESLGRLVAIKECYPTDFATREGGSRVVPYTSRVKDFEWAKTSFIREAQMLARFQHPAIVRVVDIFEDNGTAYMVMEYEQGRTLDKWMEEPGNVATEAAVRRMLESLLGALWVVHAAKVLHRDIKPENVMVRPDGSVVLIDFGSARQNVESKSRPLSAIVSDGYSPPEQYLQNGEQGAYTDLYALSAVVYHWITGQRPTTATDRIYATTKKRPDPFVPLSQSQAGRYSPTLLTALDTALQIDEEARPQSVDAFEELLEGKRAKEQAQIVEEKTRLVRRRDLPKPPAGEVPTQLLPPVSEVPPVIPPSLTQEPADVEPPPATPVAESIAEPEENTPPGIEKEAAAVEVPAELEAPEVKPAEQMPEEAKIEEKPVAPPTTLAETTKGEPLQPPPSDSVVEAGHGTPSESQKEAAEVGDPARESETPVQPAEKKSEEAMTRSEPSSPPLSQAPRSKKPWALMVALLLVLGALGYTFGIYLPGQKREEAQHEAARRMAEEQRQEQDKVQAQQRAYEQASTWVSELALTASDEDLAKLTGKVEAYAENAPGDLAAKVKEQLTEKKNTVLGERERVRLEQAKLETERIDKQKAAEEEARQSAEERAVHAEERRRLAAICGLSVDDLKEIRHPLVIAYVLWKHPELISPTANWTQADWKIKGEYYPSSKELDAINKVASLVGGKGQKLVALCMSTVVPEEAGKTEAQERILDASLESKNGFKIDNLALRMVRIDAGSFTMGNTSAQADDSEKVLTRVTITRPYWMGQTEVTQRQWETVMGNNPSNFRGLGTELPVESVSYDDALTFCAKMNERERAAGHLPEGYAYTLPTEAQWEYACRAGTTGDYAGDLDSMAWYEKNSGGQTHGVGTQKKANAWGLYDMEGNVFEWCLDWYGNYPGGSVNDYAGPPSGSERVIRGGGWFYMALFCRSSARGACEPIKRSSGIGFRLALSPVPRERQGQASDVLGRPQVVLQNPIESKLSPTDLPASTEWKAPLDPKTGAKIYSITEAVADNHSDIVRLILGNKSMTDSVKQYWLDSLPNLSSDHVRWLRSYLKGVVPRNPPKKFVANLAKNASYEDLIGGRGELKPTSMNALKAWNFVVKDRKVNGYYLKEISRYGAQNLRIDMPAGMESYVRVISRIVNGQDGEAPEVKLQLSAEHVKDISVYKVAGADGECDRYVLIINRGETTSVRILAAQIQEDGTHCGVQSWGENEVKGTKEPLDIPFASAHLTNSNVGDF